jgi:hypothetical protein
VRIKIPVYFNAPQTDLEEHAATHELTFIQLYLKKHGFESTPTCRCGCGETTKFTGWWTGFNEFIFGHQSYIHNGIYDKETEARITETRGINWRNKPGVWFNRTKQNDEATRKRAEATSAGRKKAFNEASITIWSKGKTKETSEAVSQMALEQKERFATGKNTPWTKGLTKETDTRIKTMSEKVSLSLHRESLRSRLDDLKRLKHDEITARIEKNSNLEVVDDIGYKSDAIPNIHVRCKQCGSEWESSLRKLRYGKCYKCDAGGSKAQAEIASFIESLGVNVNKNDRTTINGEQRMAELDVFIPSKMIAIEYNGLYWHNETQKSRQYHQNKTTMCKNVGITLIHVFEDEWRDKKNIVKSMIVHRLGLTPNRISARKCTTNELSSAQRKTFFNENHIEGDTRSIYAFGLFNEGTIVAAMSLRKPFHKKHERSIEIARFCTKINTSVAGALGKLTKIAAMKAIETNHSSLLTYVDTHLGVQNSWQSAGWTFVNESPERFWWTDYHTRFNRFKFKANKTMGLSEIDVANAANVVKIWGCRNLVFELALITSREAPSQPAW